MKNKSYIFAGLGVLVLIAGYFLLANVDKRNKSNNIEMSATPDTGVADTQSVVIDYKQGMPFEAKSVKVEEGKKVKLTVTGDISDQVHFHGYDLSGEIVPGKPVIIEFVADKTGRFELELENKKTVLGYIEVYPK